jgi:hypothetical protein
MMHRASKMQRHHCQRFEQIIRADPTLMDLLVRLRDLRLPQWRLVAGCLYQTVWNHLTGRPRGTGIQDYDLIYFEPTDLSWHAEDAVIRRVSAAIPDAPAPIQPRNQARVHLWFEHRFGTPYSPLASADESLLRYAAIVHAVGVRLNDDNTLDVAAPFGLDDVFAMVIRPNYALDNAAAYTRKAERARLIWPQVTVIPWHPVPGP